MTIKLARKFLLVGVSVAALAASAAEAGAKVFRFTGSVQTYTVPETGEYEIILAGAQGGSSSDGNAGGMGAVVGGDIFLKQNELLRIFVGGAGYSFLGYAGGGGGGTFLGNPNKVFFIAGGGGGGGYGDRSIADGRPGRSQRSASAGRGGNGGYGGSGGYGGEGGQDPTGFNGGGGSGLNGYGGDGFYGKKGLSGYGRLIRRNAFELSGIFSFDSSGTVYRGSRDSLPPPAWSASRSTLCARRFMGRSRTVCCSFATRASSPIR